MSQSQDTKIYNSEMYEIAVRPLYLQSYIWDWDESLSEEKIQKKVLKRNFADQARIRASSFSLAVPSQLGCLRDSTSLLSGKSFAT